MKRSAYRLTLYKRGRFWWVAGWDPESRRKCYRSLREESHAVARALHSELSAAWNRGEQIFPPPVGARAGGAGTGAGTLGELAESWLERRRGAVKPGTWTSDANRLRRWVARAGTDRSDRLRPEAVEGALARVTGAGCAAGTWNQYLFLVRRFLGWLAGRGLCAAGLCTGLAARRVERQAIEYLTERQRDAVLRAARGTPYARMVALALLAGLRLGEIKRLEWRDVDLGRKTLLVRQAKSGRPRQVPLCRELRRALGRQPAGGGGHVCPEVAGNLKEFLARLGAAAGGVRVNWLICRHTFASLLVQRGVSLAKVSAWLGHSRYDVTLRHYATVAPGYDRDVEE